MLICVTEIRGGENTTKIVFPLLFLSVLAVLPDRSLLSGNNMAAIDPVVLAVLDQITSTFPRADHEYS